MRQDVAVYHPNARVHDSDPPRAPSRRPTGHRLAHVLVQHRSVASHGLVAKLLYLGFVGGRVVRPVPAPDVVVVLAVRVERMRLHHAAVVHERARVLEDDLQHLADSGGERERPGVPAVVLLRRLPVRNGRLSALVDVDEDGHVDALVGPGEMGELPHGLPRLRVHQLLAWYDDSTGDLCRGGCLVLFGVERREGVLKPVVHGLRKSQGRAARRGRDRCLATVPKHAVPRVSRRAVSGLPLDVVGGAIPVGFEFLGGLGPEQGIKPLTRTQLKMVHRDRAVVLPGIRLDDGQIAVALYPERQERKTRRTNEAEAVRLSWFDVDDGKPAAAWSRCRYVTYSDALAVQENRVRLAGPLVRHAIEVVLERSFALVEVIVELKNSLVVVRERRSVAVVDDERTGTTQGLHADMRVIEVGPGVVRLRLDLVVEEVPRRDGPLRCHRRAVGERGHPLDNTVPMLASRVSTCKPAQVRQLHFQLAIVRF